MSDQEDRTPEFAAELGRKGLEQLQKWSDKYDQKVITRREFYIAVSTIFDTMSGLAPWEDLDVVNAVHDTIRLEAKREAQTAKS